MKTKSLQARCLQSLNRAGISDMNGDLYNTRAPVIVRHVIRRARADFKRTAKARADALPALLALVKLYASANDTGKGPEWIACITPQNAANMTRKERAASQTWAAWDKARAILKRAGLLYR